MGVCERILSIRWFRVWHDCSDERHEWRDFGVERLNQTVESQAGYMVEEGIRKPILGPACYGQDHGIFATVYLNVILLVIYIKYKYFSLTANDPQMPILLRL